MRDDRLPDHDSRVTEFRRAADKLMAQVRRRVRSALDAAAEKAAADDEAAAGRGVLDAYFGIQRSVEDVIRMNEDIIAAGFDPPGWDDFEWAILAAGLGLPDNPPDRNAVWRAVLGRVRLEEAAAKRAARRASTDVPPAERRST